MRNEQTNRRKGILTKKLKGALTMFSRKQTTKMAGRSSPATSFPVRVVLFLAILMNCMAEVQDFNILLPPTDMYIHFADGYLRGPGASIDLRDLTFKAVSEAGVNIGTGSDDSMNDDGGDDMVDTESFDGGDNDGEFAVISEETDEGVDDYGDNGGEGPRNRQQRRRLDGGIDISGSTTIDIVSFMLPSKCADSRSGCDWTDLGVGSKLDDDTLRWCCTNDAIDMGMCEGNEQYGRLIIAKDFAGTRRSVSVPNEGPMVKKLKNDYFAFNETGRYVVVFANCNEAGREVMVSGEAIWKSTHGYLPGELFGFMYFYTALLVIYTFLFVWYGGLMRLHVASRIPIEKWILMTISIGFAELLFRTLDYWDWNADGREHDWLTYLGILMGVFKHGVSRCLIVMVSLGWGVIRDSLGSALHRVVILGLVYVGVAGVRDFMIIFAVEDMQTMSYDQEVELFDLATILTFVVAAVDVIFIMWILDALSGTMMYLENMNQTRKLARYLRLRTIFLFSILFATVWAVFSLVNTYDEDGIVREEHEWVVDAATELNYLFVLVGVAILWRPNPNAKEYAYVMELNSGDGEGTELELSGVPSAMDDDDDDEPSNGVHRNGGGYHDDKDDYNFKIDDGESA